ncbi:12433_t:CDS:10 [Entrophospora sp. SA101]|nr:8119_t:CDS:10 [Entrophospora sp. SA101]CAJ0825572.1 12433_t:CDS:10 [Entrophospora sp. SA101]
MLTSKPHSINSWEFLKEDDYFYEIMLDALIPLMYCVGSVSFLIIIYIKNINQNNQVYQPLLNNQRQDSAYGSFQRGPETLGENLGGQGQEEDVVENVEEDEYDHNSDATLVSSDELIGPTKKTKKFDIVRLLLSSIMLGRYLSPELSASLYDQITFSWVNPLISKGFRKTLDESDIYELPKFNRARNILKKFHSSRKSSFVLSLFSTFKKELCIQSAYSLVWITISSFGPPYFLKEILIYVENYPIKQEDSRSTAYYYVFGLLLSTIVPSLCFQQSLYIGRQICIKIQDTSGATNDENSKNKTGNITNLMAVDAQKVSEISSYFFYLAMLLTYPVPTYINQRFEKFQIRLMAATDKRLGVINESQFRGKVMEARELELIEIRNRLVQWIYLGCLWTALPLLVMLSVFLTYTKILGYDLSAPVAFTALALFNKLRHALDEIPSTIIAFIQARVSISRVEKFLAEPEISNNNNKLNQQSLFDENSRCLIGFKDASFRWPDGGDSDTTTLNNLPPSLDSPSINDQSNKFLLRDLNVSFPVNELSIICGPTGCGKTSLLMALLCEMECLNGYVFLPRKSNSQLSKNIVGGAPSGVAYVAQTAWLQNATIRDNILFGLPYEEVRYNNVISMCALIKDLDVFESGDTTEIGEKGITLSGGQKQRIALARALYSQAEIVIMDDCLSAVDSHTAKYLYENCIMGDLMKNRTRILVTHHVGLCIRNAAFVVVMKDGQITDQGPANQILSSGILGDISIEEENEKGGDDDELKNKSTEHAKPKSKSANGSDGKLVLEEKREQGAIKWIVYKTYLSATGGYLFWVFLLSMFILVQALQVGQAYSETSLVISNFTSQFSNIFDYLIALFQESSYYSTNIFTPLEYFSSSFSLTSTIKTTTSIIHASKEFNSETTIKEKVDVNFYIGVYVLIGLFTSILASFRSYYMFMGSLSASKKFHTALVDQILKAKIRFFDTTPIGRIMNRFSKDMETIDQDLSPILMFLIHSCFATAAVIFAISLVMPQFLFAGILIAIIFIIISAYFIATSRDLKRIESVTRSPIYAAFGETINGVTTIRAFGAQYRLMNKTFTLVDNNNTPYLYNWACIRWLHTRVDLAGSLVCFSTGLIILYRLPKGMSPGLAGFALLYALNFTESIIWVIRMYAMQEINMNSVERVQEYLKLEEEPPRIIEINRPPVGWPMRGEIHVNNLVMQYSPDSPLVLKGISFHVKPTEKIGIVGRTGSGKSTLAISFFRFMEFVSGQIIIDGIDISTLGLFDLRKNLTIIPQDPVLFSEHDDLSLMNALRRAHFIDNESTITSLPTTSSPNNNNIEIIEDGDNSNDTDALLIDNNTQVQSPTTQSSNQITWSLDSLVSENGGNFSQGQRQLIALARALVRSSKLIIMDEATASVDFKTDHMIQETIRQEFKESTLLCIAHRIRTVADYDRILVLDEGRLVEFDHPYTLMQSDDSLFRTMCERSGEFAELLDIAKAKYEKDLI